MSKKTQRIQTNKANQGSRFTAHEPPDYESKPPIFSLEKLQPGKYCFSRLDRNCKAMFAEAIYKRKSLTWRELKSAGRHGLGTEKMSRSAIKATMPEFIKDDVKDFMVFRYHGTRPMVGIRQHDIFYVLWFDPNYSLYDH